MKPKKKAKKKSQDKGICIAVDGDRAIHALFAICQTTDRFVYDLSKRLEKLERRCLVKT